MSRSILIADDEEAIRRNLEIFFKRKNFSVYTAADGTAAIEACANVSIDLVLLDLRLPDIYGLEVLEKIKTMSPDTAVIIITAHGDVETAVRAMRLRADNFVLKPMNLDSIETLVEKTLKNYRANTEIQFLKQKVSRLDGAVELDKLRQPQEIHHAISLLAENSSTNALILGETGTGKGMVAQTIHQLSDRREVPFVDINCAGLSSELLESELFGHERGAYTDAKESKKGLLEVADGGSIFLDEVGELSPKVQAKLLKVIEQKEFRRLGGTATVRVDARIMAATNLDLEAQVKNNNFRKDLFYRLNVMPITLPPLRKRQNDIIPLAQMFVEEYRKIFGKAPIGLSEEARQMLLDYQWPGNIRELKNVMERAVLLSDSNAIEPVHLPEGLKNQISGRNGPASPNQWNLEQVEKSHIAAALQKCDYNRSNTAKLLGIHRSTLINKIKKYGLDS